MMIPTYFTCGRRNDDTVDLESSRSFASLLFKIA